MEWLKEHRHRILAYFWVFITIPAAIWWPDSVLWVIIVSHYANTETSLAADNANKSRKDDKTQDKLDAIAAALIVVLEDSDSELEAEKLRKAVGL